MRNMKEALQNGLVEPARCTDTTPTEFKDHHVAEIKLDGARYVLYLGANVDPYERQQGNALVSRYVSKVDHRHVDKTDNVPHITHLEYPGLEGTVLDGEIYRGNLRETNSIMVSGAAVAVQKQRDSGKWCQYVIWDVMRFRGNDVRGLPLEKRRLIVEAVVRRMNNEHITAIQQWRGNFREHFDRIVAEGGEGLVIKDLRMGYSAGWSKMKKVYDVSGFISGFRPGSGKFAGSVGAIELSVLDSAGRRIVIGHVGSGLTDTMRQDMAEEPDEWIGKVVDVFAYEMSKPSAQYAQGRLRDPSFIRFREEMSMEDCTLEKLREDFTKATSGRKSRFARAAGE